MNKLAKRLIFSGAIGTVFALLLFYIWLPAVSLYSVSFWIFLIFVLLGYFVPYFFIEGSIKIAFTKSGIELIDKNTGKKLGARKRKSKKGTQSTSAQPCHDIGNIIFISIIAVIISALILGGIISSTVFNARKYASVITVTDASFEEDMPEVEKIENIALMDSASAVIIGNRALDKLADVVSQFVAGEEYTQINLKGLPKKVTSLEYAGFFKWLGNRDTGIPGYIMVDPVNNNAEYVPSSTSIKYSSSGYFGDDLYRRLRFDYPTKMFDFISFEVSEEGKPFYVVSCVKPKIFPFGGYDVSEVIIFDPTTGSSEIFDVSNTPSWIDAVFSGDLACEKYNWHGTLSGGFINSIIGNKGCKMTTDDYGYITRGDDVWYFTGVTSVTADSSNIGFMLSNARTGEYKYYTIGGAEEHSAMEAAQGEVQEKGYVASFPSLVNISGEATYIMVLKDDNGIVKLYALVNVENYNIVATGDTQRDVMNRYRELLVERGEISSIPGTSGALAQITVAEIKSAVMGGESYIYIKDTNGITYRGKLSDNEALILVAPGDEITISYEEGDTPKIKHIIELK